MNVLIYILGLIVITNCNRKETLQLQSIKSGLGWGYTITYNEKIIINQTVIPVISYSKSFKSEEEALKVGNLVLQKLKDNLSPTVTKKDLILLKIKT